jgi:hypothetical protein
MHSSSSSLVLHPGPIKLPPDHVLCAPSAVPSTECLFRPLTAGSRVFSRLPQIALLLNNLNVSAASHNSPQQALTVEPGVAELACCCCIDDTCQSFMLCSVQVTRMSYPSVFKISVGDSTRTTIQESPVVCCVCVSCQGQLR